MMSPVHCRHRPRPTIRKSIGGWTGTTRSPRWMPETSGQHWHVSSGWSPRSPAKPAPKLASAATAELMLDTDDAPDAERLRRSAERYYRTLWRTDHSMVSAAFGLARQLAARDDRAGAIDVLDQVPLTSRHYGEAQLTSVLILLDGRPIAEITEADLRDAARRVGHLTETEPRALQMRALVLGTALDWLRSGATPASGSDLRPLVRPARVAHRYRGGASGTGAALAAAAPSLHPGRPGEFDQTAELDVSRLVAVGR